MPDSSYYHGEYQKYKSQVNDYEKRIKALKEIKNSLTGDFYDEQSNVNKELNDLQEDLDQSVRRDSSFSTTASQSCSHKEKATTADGNLNGAIVALENELASLNNKKSTAERNRDSSYQSYCRKKEEERQAWLESLKRVLDKG